MMLIIAVLLFVALCCVLLYSRRQAAKLEAADKVLAKVNAELKKNKSALFESNRIKENFLSGYMELGGRYPEKEFNSIFDRHFLAAFPDFTTKVNSLLREDARFDTSSSDKSLPTEIRILAMLRLGIESSQQISAFLRCSVSTVYTYRAKLRNQALCPKEEFETRVKSI